MIMVSVEKVRDEEEMDADDDAVMMRMMMGVAEQQSF